MYVEANEELRSGQCHWNFHWKLLHTSQTGSDLIPATLARAASKALLLETRNAKPPREDLSATLDSHSGAALQIASSCWDMSSRGHLRGCALLTSLTMRFQPIAHRHSIRSTVLTESIVHGNSDKTEHFSISSCSFAK